MPKKKKKFNQKISTIILIIVFVIIISIVTYYTFIINQEVNTNNQSVGNYNIPITNIEPEDFVCPTQKYLNCMPPVLPDNEYCKNPYRGWISENCREVTILE